MRSAPRRRSVLRRAHVEQFEERLALSAQGVVDVPLEQWQSAPIEQLSSGQTSPPDFTIEQMQVGGLESLTGDIETFQSTVNNLFGVTYAQNIYGLTGIGQTVAVIDSGIAYDHYALGGGFGQGYRVVGGWDFTEENDANPYDDGPAGFHGTHVAGIIGSTDANYGGVSPGVDLVALRVFNDQGQGYFSWVEKALQWVHVHRNDFANPITTVNLSLGVSGENGNAPPSWATLEDEFAQLKADGIFISVAAGNQFTTFNQAGLSYPAESPYVVPVASVTNAGNFSSFSQRSTRVIAAPGQSITSTVPDYAGNYDGKANDFATASGTSMAAPFAAGASTLVRQALDFAGIANINQDTIYNAIYNTADVFFDSATSQWYHRLNLQKALDAIMPADEYGSTVATAYGLGTLNGTSSFAGVIGRLDDVDYFTFTAGGTGKVTFTADVNYQLAAKWNVNGATGQVGGAHGEKLELNVVAGQTYTVGLATSQGIGHYSMEVKLEKAFTYTDWGAVSYAELNGVSNAAGDTWYRIQASQAGWLTVQALFSHAAGNVDIALYNAQQQLLTTSAGLTGTERVDVNAAAGDVFFLKVSGANSAINFRLANLVSQSGSVVTVAGTSGNDTFTFSAGTNYQVGVNGLTYQFAASSVSEVRFAGGAGQDTAQLTGSAANDQAEFRAGSVVLTGSGYRVSTTDTETNTVYSGGGSDSALFFDSAADDVFTASPSEASMIGGGFTNRAVGFGSVTANASGGNDTAWLYDSSGNDTYRAARTSAALEGTGFSIRVNDFEAIYAVANSGGQDMAWIYGSSGDDQLTAKPTYSVLRGAGYYNYVQGFGNVYAYGGGGNDVASMYDSAGDDRFYGKSTYSILRGDSFYNYAQGFGNVYAYASSGRDQAFLYDSAGDDFFEGRTTYSRMSGAGYAYTASGFDDVFAYASTGIDQAKIYGSTGNDRYEGRATYSTLSGAGYSLYAGGFDSVLAYGGGGSDSAVFYDSAGDDRFYGKATYSVFRGDGFYHYVQGFGNIQVYATQGRDQAWLYDSAGDELFEGRSNYSRLTGATFAYTVTGFDDVFAYASGGYDQAKLYGSVGNDRYEGRPTTSTLVGSGYTMSAAGFDMVMAYGGGGADVAYLYDSAGNDRFYGKATYSVFRGDGFYNYVQGFGQVNAVSTAGGVDQAWLYDSVGNDFFVNTPTESVLSGSGFSNRATGFANIWAYASSGLDQAVFSQIGALDTVIGSGDMMSLSNSWLRAWAYGFDQVTAEAKAGQSPTADMNAVDYVFDKLGSWQ